MAAAGRSNLTGASRRSWQDLPWAGIWGLADQSLVSASNFLAVVLLARALEPSAFGLFLLGYTALLFVNQLQNSLITRPHNVLAAALEGGEYASFTTAAAIAQAVFSVGVLLVALGCALVAAAAQGDMALLLFALGPAAFAWQMQEFLRQVMYTKGLVGRAFVCDLISYGGQALLVALLFASGKLSGTGVLFALAGSSLLAAMAGCWQVRNAFGRPDWEALTATWRFGRWLLGDGVGSWLSSNLYPLLTAAIVGVSGVAVLKAAQNLLAPGQVVMNAFMAYAVPRAARAEAYQGRKQMKRFVMRTATSAGLLLVVYWCGISALAGPALSLLYGETYAGYGALVGLMGLAYFAFYVTIAQSVALLAMERTSAIFAGRLVAIVLTFSAGLVLVWWFGTYGAAIGSALSQLGLAMCLVNSLSRADANTGPRLQAGLIATSPTAGSER